MLIFPSWTSRVRVPSPAFYPSERPACRWQFRAAVVGNHWRLRQPLRTVPKAMRLQARISMESQADYRPGSENSLNAVAPFTPSRTTILALFSYTYVILTPCYLTNACYAEIEKGVFTPKTPRWKVAGRQSSSV